MPQLIMNWTNDGTPACFPSVPEGLELRTLPEVENGIEEWLDIVHYGLSGKREDKAFYESCMCGTKYYDPALNFMILCDGHCAGTLTVVCDPEKKEGLIHMVACKEEFRGRGIGTFMITHAVAVLKACGMVHAHLTTDDWRVPAIRSYLRAGFVPDESTEDFITRWKAIRAVIAEQNAK
ncbi:MAG: GNAT family N-acetyltransferase [Clostridia bacterium]|nr:GNAT family N-acetyltransferase [Clostridia bacterium]